MPTLKTTDFLDRAIRAQIETEPAYLVQAEEYYEGLFSDYGLDFTTDKPEVINNTIKRMLINYTNSQVCLNLIGPSYRQTIDGVQEDPYKIKYDQYIAKYKEDVVRVNKAALLNTVLDVTINSGRIGRG